MPRLLQNTSFLVVDHFTPPTFSGIRLSRFQFKETWLAKTTLLSAKLHHRQLFSTDGCLKIAPIAATLVKFGRWDFSFVVIGNVYPAVQIPKQYFCSISPVSFPQPIVIPIVLATRPVDLAVKSRGWSISGFCVLSIPFGSLLCELWPSGSISD